MKTSAAVDGSVWRRPCLYADRDVWIACFAVSGFLVAFTTVFAWWVQP